MTDPSHELDRIAVEAEARGVHIDAFHDDFDGTIHVNEIARDLDRPETKGRGAETLERVCALADRIGTSVHLSHLTGETALAAYYARFGFAHDPGQHPSDPIWNMTRHCAMTTGPTPSTSMTEAAR